MNIKKVLFLTLCFLMLSTLFLSCKKPPYGLWVGTEEIPGREVTLEITKKNKVILSDAPENAGKAETYTLYGTYSKSKRLITFIDSEKHNKAYIVFMDSYDLHLLFEDESIIRFQREKQE